MKQRRSDVLVRIFLMATMTFFAVTHADYDEDYCHDFIDPLTAEGTNEMPYFFDDFKVIAERILITDPGDIDDPAWVQDVQYSTTKKQALLQQYYDSDSVLFYIDENSQDCIYDQQGDECYNVDDTCATVATLDSFVSVDSLGVASIGSSSSAMNWPTDTKEEAYVELSDVEEGRKIQCDMLITCSYDATLDQTTVSEWYLLAPEAYSQMDQTINSLVSAVHHHKRAGAVYDEQRIDYTNYENLEGGIQFPPVACSSIESSLNVKDMPVPDTSFSYSVDRIQNQSNYISLTFEQIDYNYGTQLYQLSGSVASDDVNGKYDLLYVMDYSTGNEYDIDKASLRCTMVPSYISTISTMQTSSEFWGLDDAAIPTYMGQYSTRDIPVDTWFIEYSDGRYDSNSMVTIDLATDSWLESQGYSKGIFYPIGISLTTPDKDIFESVLEFKSNPGYNIPDVSSCYNLADAFSVTVTIKADYDTTVSSNRNTFEYTVRELVRSITGIVSLLRIPLVYAYSSGSGETTVNILILGKYTDYDPSADGFYDSDPVTSVEAAAKLESAVAAGSYSFNLDGDDVIFEFKAGSYAKSDVDADTYELFMDPPQTAPAQSVAAGYSSGAMAAVGILLLLIGLVLGVGGVYTYVRFFDYKNQSNVSRVPMSKLNEEL